MSPRPPEPDATLDQWLSYLERLHASEIDLGLERVLVVLRRLFRGHPAARIITVAGTNGKGTTIAALEAMLRAAGRSVATYTSPHLQRFNERMRVDGVEADDAAIIRALEVVNQARGSTSLTYFEFTTLAAFVLFRQSNVDDWLLEVGLGGRLDAVNVLDADLAIITAIAVDHEAFLGTDREKIGFEKAGILRPGRPAVLADPAPPRSILQQSAAQKIPLYRFGVDFQLTTHGVAKTVTGTLCGQSVDLPGRGLPEASIAAAVQAIWLLEPEMPSQTLTKAIAQLHLPGRFEQVENKPAIYIDVGHNPHAAQWLAERVSLAVGSGRLHAVYAGLADKDTAGVLKALADAVSHWYFASLPVPRGLSAQQILARAVEAGLEERHIRCCPSVADAIEQSRAAATADDCILVFGSFYTVAAARSRIAGTS